MSALDDVLAERARQDAKWGEQNHPWWADDDNHHGPDDGPCEILLSSWGSADEVKAYVDRSARAGELTFAAILLEEFAEALEATGAELRAELVQVAAVALAALESLDRNGR